MIKINHEEYGDVVIVEDCDRSASAFVSEENSMETDVLLSHISGEFRGVVSQANIVAYRNVKEKHVRIIKDRYIYMHNEEFMQFILNYGIEDYDPILTRFEILDL